MEQECITCAGCGRELSEEYNQDKKLQCPDCGGTKRNCFFTLETRVTNSVSVSEKNKDQSGFLKQEESEKASYSYNSGRPVKIKKVIERTNQDCSKFDHIVEELDEHGILYKIIHHDGNVSPAKHRPGKKM